MTAREYQQCTLCVMDTSDTNITFDDNGACHHCNYYPSRVKEMVISGQQGLDYLTDNVVKIKERGLYKKYNCLLGVSGGADSSYVALIAHKMGLRPLLVHFDNCYNDKRATDNIKAIVKKTGFDIRYFTMDKQELVDLQLAYLKASVVDIEVITDHAISATLYKIAKEEGIKYILGGSNVATETIYGDNWSYRKNDLMNIKDIYKKCGSLKKLKTYPTLGLCKYTYYKKIKRIKVFYPLNYVDYNLKETKEALKKEFGWIDYGEKHYESIFTRFYQAYILPQKFGVDKRLGHYSSLICSHQMTREEALHRLHEPLYTDSDFMKDRGFILDILGISNEEFTRLMELPVRKHTEFKTDMFWFALLRVMTVFTRPATFKRRVRRFFNLRK